jgi:K+-transporting ATPase KdpF subunit
LGVWAQGAAAGLPFFTANLYAFLTSKRLFSLSSKTTAATYGRPDLSRCNCRIRYLLVPSDPRLRAHGGQEVSLQYAIGAIACIGVFIYLVYALIRAEDF